MFDMLWQVWTVFDIFWQFWHAWTDLGSFFTGLDWFGQCLTVLDLFEWIALISCCSSAPPFSFIWHCISNIYCNIFILLANFWPSISVHGSAVIIYLLNHFFKFWTCIIYIVYLQKGCILSHFTLALHPACLHVNQ